MKNVIVWFLVAAAFIALALLEPRPKSELPPSISASTKRNR